MDVGLLLLDGLLAGELSSAAERTLSSFWRYASYPPSLLEGGARFWLISLLVYAVAYPLFIKRVEKNGLLQIDDPVMVLVTALVIVINMVLDVVVKDIVVPTLAYPAMTPTPLAPSTCCFAPTSCTRSLRLSTTGAYR